MHITIPSPSFAKTSGAGSSTADAGRVFILDEVDALVIDEEPNEPTLGRKRRW